MHHPHNPTHDAPETVNDTRVLCHHTFDFTEADQPARGCGSPALRGETFCYYHHPTRKPSTKSDLTSRRERQLARRRVSFPLPTTRAELQHALLYLTHLIATNEIDTRRAGLLLFALQNTAKALNG